MKTLMCLVAALMCGCVLVKEKPLEVSVEKPKGDYAAIAFFDCNELIVVEFIGFDGKFEQVRIQGAAHLFDTQLRMSRVEYENVQYVQNARPCGFLPET